jgi:protein involved in polysaccharide export with SLBB domain
MYNAVMLVHNRRPARRLIAIGLGVLAGLFGSVVIPSAYAQQGGQETRTGLQGGGRAGEGAQTNPNFGQGRPANEAPVIAEDPIDPNQPAVPGCQIVVTVVNEPEPGGAYIVDGGGNVFIHIAESATPVNIKDQTTTQAAATIATFLKKFMRDPKVTVTIVSVPRPIVYISGAVHFTGPVQVNKSTALIDVLSRSDVLDTADLSQVRVTRTQTVGGAEKKLAMALHVDTYMKPQPGKELDESQNPTLQDKDRIFVPFKALVGNGGITIAGEIVHPMQGMLLRTNPPMTLREAISLAGGVTMNANRRAISVRHSTGEPITVDLDKADQNDPANNVVLQPDDAIYVEKLPITDYFSVEGGFKNANRFPYLKDMTLTEAIIAAGGPAPYSKDKDGHILRPDPSNDPKKAQIIPFSWPDLLKKKQADVKIYPGDQIWISPGNPPQQGYQLQQMAAALSLLRPL